MQEEIKMTFAAGFFCGVVVTILFSVLAALRLVFENRRLREMVKGH